MVCFFGKNTVVHIYLEEGLVLVEGLEVNAEVEAGACGVQGVGQRDKVVLDVFLIGELAVGVEVDKQVLGHNAKVVEDSQGGLAKGGVACWSGGSHAVPDGQANLQCVRHTINRAHGPRPSKQALLPSCRG